jgi:hypothetical protein
MKHVHSEVIHAFADGDRIQFLDGGVWVDIENPSFDRFCSYRVKPKGKAVKYAQIFNEPDRVLHLSDEPDYDNIKLTFDENGKLIAAEVL